MVENSNILLIIPFKYRIMQIKQHHAEKSKELCIKETMEY